MTISAINQATGEIIELPANTPQEIVEAWLVAQQYSKAADALKDQLKQLVPDLAGDKGLTEPIGNYQFRVSSIQRTTYDKSAIHTLIKDEDLRYEMLKPDKQFIDKYLKENIESLGSISTLLRSTMVAEGKPYQVIKLERLS